MKIGLLECDHVRDELLYLAGDYREMFPSLFSKVTTDWEFVFYDVCNGQFPNDADDCAAYICTGSRFSVYDDEPWIHQLKDFVNQLYQKQKVYIGVCFGHQMLGEALGGKVRKSELGWCVGAHTFEVLYDEPWMIPAVPSFNLLMMCQDQVQELPPNSTVLAQTPNCPVGMFKVGDSMLGIQAHPEFSKAYDQALMELRVDRMGADTVEKGIKSLEKPVDDLLIAGWIRNFVEANQFP